ncbi:hypothetical protein FDZ71_05210, partial [bacterium]
MHCPGRAAFHGYGCRICTRCRPCFSQYRAGKGVAHVNRLVASIDLGTNTARLLIGYITAQGKIQPVLHKSRISRLGGGFSRDTGIAPAAWCRTLHILEEFAKDIEVHDVAAVHAVATSAVRDASNGKEFIADVHMRTGIPLRIITGTEEAYLNLQGVLSGLGDLGDLFVFDVGGGSTEYVLTRGRSAIFSRSLPLGVVRLTEGQESLNAMDAKITKELMKLREELEAQEYFASVGTSKLVGTAGTVTTLAALHRQIPHTAACNLHGTQLGYIIIKDLYRLLVSRSPEERL